MKVLMATKPSPNPHIFFCFLKHRQESTTHKAPLSQLHLPCPISLKHGTIRWKLLQVTSKKSFPCLLRLLFTYTPLTLRNMKVVQFWQRPAASPPGSASTTTCLSTLESTMQEFNLNPQQLFFPTYICYPSIFMSFSSASKHPCWGRAELAATHPLSRVPTNPFYHPTPIPLPPTVQVFKVREEHAG